MIDLAKYKDMKICVAVSGGRDSMALLHYLYANGKAFNISVSALNCDHKIRGEASARDSAFVAEWCSERKIPLAFFEWNTDLPKTELNARLWRRECYKKALEEGADAVACAHHLNDNAETVLFNLARGSALSGLGGITDGGGIIHPLINCTRARIEEYVKENKITFVDDESNFTEDYTRNKLRLNVLPELERAVPNAAEAIFRFSRLAAEDEKYFEDVIENRKLIKEVRGGVEISHCEEKVVFKRAAVKVIKDVFLKKDYTSAHAERLYNLQFAENGKAFRFLGLTAYREGGGIVLTEKEDKPCGETAFYEYEGQSFCGQPFAFVQGGGKTLKFDGGKIPKTAVIRFMREGDRFKKFGGGTKSLGDFFTDKKIPVRIRRKIPLVADGNEVLIVGGVEISDKLKISPDTEKILYLSCIDYAKEEL